VTGELLTQGRAHRKIKLKETSSRSELSKGLEGISMPTARGFAYAEGKAPDKVNPDRTINITVNQEERAGS
jgi:hypothetical protein